MSLVSGFGRCPVLPGKPAAAARNTWVSWWPQRRLVALPAGPAKHSNNSALLGNGDLSGRTSDAGW